MNKLLLSLSILIASVFVANSQTPPLNKQETIDYMNKVLKTSRGSGRYDSVYLKDKILSVKRDELNTYRYDLARLTSLQVASYSNGSKVFEVKTDQGSAIFYPIELERDAIRLRKALEHLIELVKTEKSNDPFDN